MFGLLAPDRILFGGFGGGGGHQKQMSPEERERPRRRFCRADPDRPGTVTSRDAPEA